MDILGVGPLEFVFVAVIMLLVLGPKGMVKAVHDIGEFLRKVVQSPIWKSIISSSQEIRQVQTQIIKESGLDESLKEIRASTQSINQITNNLVRPTLEEAKIDPISLKVPAASAQNSSPDKPSAPTESSSTEKSESEISAETTPEPSDPPLASDATSPG